MKLNMRWRILMIAAVLVALWAAQPAARTFYRGLREGKSTGAFVFSMVLAAGQQALPAGSHCPSRAASQ
jgi:hypothetical protein